MKTIKIKYVVLAKSIPEYSKRDETLFTCSLGYCPELGLIRVYPLPIKSMNKWDTYEIEVERNKYDTRIESWKLSSYSRKEQWVGLDKDAKYLYKADPGSIVNTISCLCKDSLKELNENKQSIGIIRVKDYRVYWNSNDRYIDTNQLGLFEDVEIADFTKYTKETKGKEARIYFKDTAGEHDLQYNEWQVYEYQRKFNASEEAFRYMKNQNMLLVGNMHNYRNIWIGLSLYKSYQYNLFDANILTENNTFYLP